VVLADADDVEADLVGELDLLQQVAQALARADATRRRMVGREVSEGVDADLHALLPPLPARVPRRHPECMRRAIRKVPEGAAAGAT
jgi:hypothetical protein